jgi:hypothetical protein
VTDLKHDIHGLKSVIPFNEAKMRRVYHEIFTAIPYLRNEWNKKNAYQLF